MNRLNLRIRKLAGAAICAALVVSAPVALPVLAPHAQAQARSDLDNAVAALRGITTLKADFTQTDRNGQRLTGVLTLKNPGRIRFQYERGVPLLIVSDGRSLTMIDYEVRQYNYIGPGGAVNNLANVATPYLDTSFGAASPGFSYPAVEFASPWLIYEAFRSNPGYFAQTTSQANDSRRNAAIRSPIVQEAVTAGYLMADLKFWQNRVRLVGGVRYELTETEGYGYRQTPTGYERRANYNSRDYDGYYPSAHLTVNLTEDLVLRAA